MTLQVGLTGGIASGKSTVSRQFAEAGFTVIDYDQIARDIVVPGTPGLKRIAQEFGPDFIDSHGNLNRIRMGALVFADTTALRKLEAITHPLIAESASKLADSGVGIVVHDNPLLIEMGVHEHCDVVVVVDAPESAQVARMVSDRGMTETDARQRMAHQLTSEERIAAADIVIDNSGDLDALKSRVADVITELRLLHSQR